MQSITNVPFPMNLPSHLCCLGPAPLGQAGEIVQLVARGDVQWGRPIFRAPALPTPLQLSSELPFSVNFPLKHPRRT